MKYIILLQTFFMSFVVIVCFQVNIRCPGKKFTCHNKQCISSQWVCDGKLDCINGEDELNCDRNLACMDTKQFLCNDGSCISPTQRCDGTKNCKNGEDEFKCETRVCDNKTEFQCRFQQGQCVPLKARCDNNKDCADLTDEAVEICLLTQAHQLVCKSDEFTCNSGSCILDMFKCDGRPDCKDKSDEDPRLCKSTGKKQVKCDEHQFSCTRHAECIALHERCDGHNDCKDGSDEERCSMVSEKEGSEGTCEVPGEFYCGMGECINKDSVCDGVHDCLNSRDEENCDASSCEKYQFYCAAKRACLPGAVYCDNVVDCPDGSDEKNCSVLQLDAAEKKRSCDPVSQFDCLGDGSKCINLSQVCDRKTDCPGAQDEMPGGNNRNCKRKLCSHNNGGCMHTCHNYFTKRVCSCKRGYKLGDDETSCLDINECEEMVGACSQICINVESSFQCDCRNGYTKNFTDPNRCEATGEKFLLYATLDSIRELRMVYNHLRPLVTDTHGVIDIEYDYEVTPRTLFWSEVKPMSGGRIMKASLGPGENQERSVVVDKGVFTPDGLAFDWINKLLFWTDKVYQRISVVNVTSGEYTIVVSTGLVDPRAIVVDPIRAVLYWTDWGKNPKIESCGTNGQDRRALIDTDIMVPNGLALDIATNQLFWADAGLSLIASINLENGQRRVLSQNKDFHPFSLAVFEDRVYWSDWRSKSIFSMDKFSGTGLDRIARTDNPMGLRILHQLQQPKATSMCAGHGCSHLCLPVRRMSYNVGIYTCACPVGMRLNGNWICVPGNVSDIVPFNHQSPVKVEQPPALSTKKKLVLSSAQEAIIGDGDNIVEDNVGTIAALVSGSIFLVTFVGSLIGYLLHRNYMARAVRSVNFENPVYAADAAMLNDVGAEENVNSGYRRIDTAEELADMTLRV